MDEIIKYIDREHLSSVIKSSNDFFSTNEEVDWKLLKKLSNSEKRSLLETDESKKQLVAYVLITNSCGDIFLTTRLKGQSEDRLHNKKSIGIGGHINDDDNYGTSTDFLLSGALREIKEEVHIDDFVSIKRIGLINHDNNPVGKVHMGVVFHLEVDKEVDVKETDKTSGEFCDPNNIPEYFLEEWSIILFNQIKKGLINEG